ncbi:helix-turn-helix domain-containing protein [Aequorivita marina]|uniref:helix-turn-helix domain-containing protein n=1 Tax=Aequorivita marina TaxID=3073654 RepID=UPI002874574F|nr:helix-turn-helix domain-containing protein [Aequorivita sp. S2608]MDS1299097.1 helix-turn-helix domain-containing protein [Aequorivita sp. S2608]
MGTKDNKRLKSISSALFAIAQGKFNMRIPRTKEDDVIESIIVLVNMMAEEMRETLQLYSELHIQTEHQEHLYIVFILDKSLNIQYVSSDVMTELGYKAEDLIHKPFLILLSKTHNDLWRTKGNKLLYPMKYNKRHSLILLDKNRTERPYYCIITPLFSTGSQNQNFMVSIYEPILQARMLEDKATHKRPAIYRKQKSYKPPNVLTNVKDRKLLRAIYQYIIENLEKPLPHLPELANKFGTNEFKLKYGFKQMYGITVFRFLKKERIKKGKLLLENTSLPIKTIAEMCGYSNPSHFSKDFRAAIGVSPRRSR